MDLGLGSNPNMHRAQKRPIQSADRSMATVGWRRPEFPAGLGSKQSRMFWDRNEKMMLENARTVRRSVDANEQARERAKTTPLRNEAPLNCVSLRSQLDWEVTCGAVKGQDERRPSAAPLTAPQVTPELDAARKKTSKVSRQDRQNGGYCGSTELPVVAPERS